MIEPVQERAGAGAGGMGTVYRAIDTRTDQTVAVKLLQAADHPQATERFAREAQLLWWSSSSISSGPSDAGDPSKRRARP